MSATDLPTLRSFGDGAVLSLKYGDVDSVGYAIERVGTDGSVRERLRENGLQNARECDVKEVAAQHISLHEAMVDPALLFSEKHLPHCGKSRKPSTGTQAQSSIFVRSHLC